MSSVVKISPIGNLGNQMLQLMLARSIAERALGLEVVGYDMPEWGLHAPVPTNLPSNTLILKGQYLSLIHISPTAHVSASRAPGQSSDSRSGYF